MSCDHTPHWISSVHTAKVERDTLKAVFCCGYVGVMMGITWQRSLGLIWEMQGSTVK